MRHGVHISTALARRLQQDSTSSAAREAEAAEQRRQSLRTRLRIRMAQLATEARNLPPAERDSFVTYGHGILDQIPKE